MITRMIAQTLAAYAVFGMFLFLSAGTLEWPSAWIFLGEMLLLSFVCGFLLYRSDPALLIERLRPPIQERQIGFDQIFMISLLGLFPSWLALMGFDAGRFHRTRSSLSIRALGAVAVAFAVLLGFRAMQENSFASPVVKIQFDRGQTVVTTGPYRFVQHPMYSAGVVFFVRVPLLLGSNWGLTGSLLLIALFVARTLAEENTLTAQLRGYERYATQVRFRLIPFIW